jgi:hypothetical protein
MNKYTLILLLVITGIGSKAQSIKALKKDMFGIASDATEGRFTGSAGYGKAAKYVVSQLRAAGLKPGWTEQGKETYLQPVPFVWDNYTGSSLQINRTVYSHSAANFIVLQRGSIAKGKWIVSAPGDKVKGNAAGIILLPDESQAKDWETTAIRQYRFGYMHYVPDGITAQHDIPTIMVSPGLAKQLAPGDSIAVTLICRQERKTGYNVVGCLPGTDRHLQDQFIVIGAHLDHIGRIGNHIYNGANDDGSGCVAELGAARAIAAHPCEHPVLFTFYCGEELNLKGSRWFVDHLAARHILMNINLEQVGSRHRSLRGVWALGAPEFETDFYASGKLFPPSDLKFSPVDSVMEVMSNTDSYSFMNKNIPSLLLGSGGFEEHHTPRDKIDLIDFEHLRKATALLCNLVLLIGNRQ